MKRRLAAILAADVVGYSRLMGKDETGTLGALKAHRSELIDPKIAEYHGHVVKLMGDGILVEFPSAVEAVLCAVEVQRTMLARNADVPEDQRIEFRVGINLGDVIVEENDIYGDGVNIASRLQELAEPSGICIARNVFNQVKNKVDLAFEDLGEHKAKNIAEPIPVYRVHLDSGTIPRISGATRRQWQRVTMAAAIVVVVVVGSFAVWDYFFPSLSSNNLADEPSIAVLPFDNLSGNPDQDYFADGFTEDLIAQLSGSPDLLVISRNSSFMYKGKPTNLKKIGRELGVRYVLEGGVRRINDRIRVTAELVDTATDHHVWAQQYDNQGTDAFSLQDEVVQRIIVAVAGEEGKIRKADYKRAWDKDAASLGEYDYYLRVHSLIYRFNKEDNALARELALEGLTKYPDYSFLQVKLGWTYMLDVRLGWSKDPHLDLEQAYHFARQGLAGASLPPIGQAVGHWLMAYAYLLHKKDIDRAVIEAETAIELAPYDTNLVSSLSQILMYGGKAEDAYTLASQAVGLEPHTPQWILRYLGWTCYMSGRYEEALEIIKRLPFSDMETLRLKAVTYAHLDLIKEAKNTVKQMQDLNSNISLSSLRRTLPFRSKVDLEHLLNDLRKAGLPD